MMTKNFQTFVNDALADKTLDFTKNGECSKCGQCCSNILPVSQREIKRIRYYIKAHGIKESIHCAPLANYIDMTCPFLNSENRCTIYEVRPQICKSFLCCRSEGAIKANREEFREQYGIINVRAEFFGR